jgi:hypothetical protein
VIGAEYWKLRRLLPDFPAGAVFWHGCGTVRDRVLRVSDVQPSDP